MADLTLTLVRPATAQQAPIFQPIQMTVTHSGTCALVNDLDYLWNNEHDCAHLNTAEAIEVINRWTDMVKQFSYPAQGSEYILTDNQDLIRELLAEGCEVYFSTE